MGRAVTAALLASLALGGCLESSPGKPKGYLGDAGYSPEPDGSSTQRRDAVHEFPVVDGAADAWAGQWDFIDGSSGLNCSGTISVTASSGFMNIMAAPSGDLLNVAVNGCSFSFFLDGATATADPPDQRCALWAIPNIPVWTLTLKDDGTLEEKLGGQVWLNGQVCMLSGKSTLMRR
jgi:hypothetical protein